jgi:ABC-type transport system substrate-binding protein
MAEPTPNPQDEAQFDELIRRAMRERWDHTPIPDDLSAAVRTRAHRTHWQRRALGAAGVMTSVAVIAVLGFAFSAMLQRQTTQPIAATAENTVEVTQMVQVPVTAIVPVTVEVTREPFTQPHPSLSDVRVRRAIAHCTDRAALLRSVYPWVTETAPFEADSFVPRGHWAYAADIARYPFDVAQGAALLDEAGWRLADGATFRTNANGDELALTLTTTDTQFRQTWAALWEEQMAACGVRIVRFHTPGAWLFGESTGLRRRDFEIVAFAWVADDEPDGRDLYACDSIPTPGNNWQGQNYMGWCNAATDAAIRTATAALDREARRTAYATVQTEMARDVPSLPLFFRANYFAVNAALENFQVDGTEWIHTWNAAQWRIPDKDTIVLGESGVPASLFLPIERAYVAQVIASLVNGVDYTHFDYDYQPVALKQIPSLENGGAVRQSVEVKAGDSVVNVSGERVELRSGVRVQTANGERVDFSGESVTVTQLVVTYEYLDNLLWSDGTPVTQADYELAYRGLCDPQIGFDQFLAALPDCNNIARVEFLSDTAYRVTWLPGFTQATAFLPPFARIPAHQILKDGRRLADVPPSEWGALEELTLSPLGIGPYVLKQWDRNGVGSMRFEANPYYFLGTPATPNLIVRFIETPEQAAQLLLAGEVDVLDPETLRAPEDLTLLAQAQAEGRPVRVFTPPSQTWEHLDFALFQR